MAMERPYREAVTDYLSPEWIDQLHATVVQAALSAEPPVVLDYDIIDAARYHVTVGPDGAAVVEGPAEAPTAIFTQDRATAVAVHAGHLSAEEAFISGRITMTGDAVTLMAHRELLGELAAVTAGVGTPTAGSGTL